MKDFEDRKRVEVRLNPARRPVKPGGAVRIVPQRPRPHHPSDPVVDIIPVPKMLPAFRHDPVHEGFWIPDVTGHFPCPGGPRSVVRMGGRGSGSNSATGSGSRVTIYKQAVFDDVDARTYRRVNTDLLTQPQEARYEVAADSKDPFDRGTLVRLILFRDAELRLKMETNLTESTTMSETDDWDPIRGTNAESAFVYEFTETLNDNRITIMREYFHRFLVLGTVLDWYREFNLPTDITDEYLENLLDKAKSLFTAGYYPTPTIPFDPPARRR